MENLLNDYHELIRNHSDYLQEISQHLIQNKSFKTCDDIKNCQFSSRHHGNSNGNIADPMVKLYSETLDSLHYYLFHLYQVGLRTKKEIHHSVDEKKYDDNHFSKMREMISTRRDDTARFERFGDVENSNMHSDSRFNILLSNDIHLSINEGQGTTYLDMIYKHLLESKIDEDVVEKLKAYVVNEDYCTESLDFDVNEIETDGNIANCINNMNCIQCIRDLIAHSRRMFIYYTLLRKIVFAITFLCTNMS